MRVIVQRVQASRVEIDGAVSGEIQLGALALTSRTVAFTALRPCSSICATVSMSFWKFSTCMVMVAFAVVVTS